MDTPNLVAILIAAISNMIVGMIWYAPPMFGDRWIRASGIDRKLAQEKQGMAVAFGGSFLCALILAFVLEHMLRSFGPAPLGEALQTIFWLWLGFAAATRLPHYLFAGRSMELYLLEIGHDLVNFFVMGGVILAMS